MTRIGQGIGTLLGEGNQGDCSGSHGLIDEVEESSPRAELVRSPDTR